jgi:hypothetical protein
LGSDAAAASAGKGSRGGRRREVQRSGRRREVHPRRQASGSADRCGGYGVVAGKLIESVVSVAASLAI